METPRELPSRSPYLLLMEAAPGSPQWIISHGAKRIATALPQERLDEALAELQDYVDHLRRPPPATWKPVYFIPSHLRPRRTTSLYFISSNEVENYPIKIGRTGDDIVASRLAELQCANPHKLIVLGVMPDRGQHEKKLHIGFAEDRLRGEWFRRSPKLMSYIRRNATVSLMEVYDEPIGEKVGNKKPAVTQRNDGP